MKSNSLILQRVTDAILKELDHNGERCLIGICPNRIVSAAQSAIYAVIDYQQEFQDKVIERIRTMK